MSKECCEICKYDKVFGECDNCHQLCEECFFKGVDRHEKDWEKENEDSDNFFCMYDTDVNLDEDYCVLCNEEKKRKEESEKEEILKDFSCVINTLEKKRKRDLNEKLENKIDSFKKLRNNYFVANEYFNELKKDKRPLEELNEDERNFYCELFDHVTEVIGNLN